MENELDYTQLKQLNNVVIECSKKYFLVKNQYYDQILEIQDSLMNKINLCDLIDTQFSLIKELDFLVGFLFKELSFRKCIIERKDRVLKDLNSVMINKFIDKIYKQEIMISELQKEKYQLLRTKSNTGSCLKKSVETIRSTTPTIITNNNTKQLPVNIIAPKNNSEYQGTYSFFNSSIKNIERFINIKNVNINGDHKESPNAKGGKVSKKPHFQLDFNNTELSPISKIRRTRPKTTLSRNENFGNSSGILLSATNKTNISNISMTATNISMNSNFNLNKTFTKNLNPSKHTTSLLNKSYELVKKYQKNQNRSVPKLKNSKSMF